MDREGFQQPKRKFWKPKARTEPTVVHHAESSSVKGTVSSSDTMVGVGSIKQVQVEPSAAPVVQSKEKPSGQVTILKKGPVEAGKPNGEAQFCTVNAGRTPVAKESTVGPTSAPLERPELVKSVVQAFKQQLQPRRGVVIPPASANRFSPLSSEEASDDDEVEVIDTVKIHMEEKSVLEENGIQSGGTVLGDAPSSISQ